MTPHSKDKTPRKLTDEELERSRVSAEDTKTASNAQEAKQIEERASRHADVASETSLGVASILYQLGRSCEGNRLLNECKDTIVRTLEAEQTEDLVAQLNWCKQGLDSLATFTKEAAIYNRSK